FFSSRRRHTRFDCDWSSDVCSSDLLRQASFEPVVASMGTALTERQLKELVRLSKRLYLCFDADAAGQEATLRGMELAAGQGFDKIGRASCRERVEGWGGVGTDERKE